MKLSLAALPLRTRLDLKTSRAFADWLQTTPTTFQSATAVPAGCAHAQYPPTPAFSEESNNRSEEQQQRMPTKHTKRPLGEQRPFHWVVNWL
ncbi:hypothetical protein ACFQHW_09465 [Lapidilactobacillus achengensis]|uniref:Uncharacterized protein n=1 Tax=Lapidilactobacillus achengensis TaxID=2486000 RepID=A0ABW1UR72_9LACO|nr:hypothetical protein [Lapidilactobacillus achengensis]